MQTSRSSLTPFILLSVLAALSTMMLKFGAYVITGSVGFFSDALESVVNLVAALSAYILLRIAEKPADDSHPYGHTKAEYFSSVIEGTFILFAALSIGYVAIERFINPMPIQDITEGIGVSTLASLINLIVALILIIKGKRNNSIVLQADGHHLLTDVWTSVGVILGVSAVSLTGIYLLDPVIALVVAGNIVFTGYNIIRNSTQGLMDASLPQDVVQKMMTILDTHTNNGVRFHQVKSRQSATKSFITLHMIVPDAWSIIQAHTLAHAVESKLRNEILGANVLIHIEPESQATLDEE